jgi:hypothetical protein
MNKVTGTWREKI